MLDIIAIIEEEILANVTYPFQVPSKNEYDIICSTYIFNHIQYVLHQRLKDIVPITNEKRDASVEIFTNIYLSIPGKLNFIENKKITGYKIKFKVKK